MDDQAAPTLQWQPHSAEPAAPSWPPNAGSAAQADPTLLAQPFGGPPAGQWTSSPQPAPGQADPTLLAQSPAEYRQPGQDATGRTDETMLAQPLGGHETPGQLAPGQRDFGSSEPSLGQAGPTMFGQPLGPLNQPASSGGWQQNAGTPGRGGPENTTPTLLGYPSADGFGQPDPNLQWQPAYGGPEQYGEVIPLERYRSGYGAAQYAPQAGFPGYGPKRSGRGKTVLLVGLVVLLVAGVAVTAVALAKRGSDSAQESSPSMVSALTTTGGAHTSAPTTKPAPTTTASGASNEAPLIPGYQVVVAPDRGAAYDVPADWAIAPQGTIGGFGEPPNAVAGKGYASEGKGYCPGSTRTVAFLTGSDDADSASAAIELGTKTAKFAYKESPGGTPSAPAPLASLDGSQHGMFVETKGTVSQAKPGCATAYSVYTVAYPSENGNFVMVIVADTGVPNALDTETAKRIFTSIRPHEG
ncbi:hypothetical protein AB4305_31975 [Nocardia sp. 2YAB30]|uniref:hypothetical protein n=1 Tax=Nocardia sp. 2YAB30 TaxID=3233022 RepID=UPI003F95C5D9